MSKEEIKNKIKDIIIQVLGLKLPPEEIKDDNVINELGINSVDALEIFVMVESQFKIAIADEDLNSKLISSLDNISSYVYERSKA